MNILQPKTERSKDFINRYESSISCLININIDAELRLKSLESFRRVLSDGNESLVQDFIDADLVKILIPFLKTSIISDQVEAIWIIANLLSGTSEQTTEVLSYGVEDILLELIKSDAALVVEQALWGVGNIAGDCPELRDSLLAKGFLPLFVDVINKFSPSKGLATSNDEILNVLKSSVWVLRTLLDSSGRAISLEEFRPVLPSLAKLLTVSDLSVVADACFSLAHFAEISLYHVRLILDYAEFQLLELTLGYLNQARCQKPIVKVLSATLIFLARNSYHEDATVRIFEGIKKACSNDLELRSLLFPCLLAAYYLPNCCNRSFKDQIKILILQIFCHTPNDNQLPLSFFLDGKGKLKKVTVLRKLTIPSSYFEASKLHQEYWKMFLLSTMSKLSTEKSFPLDKCLIILVKNRVL